MKVFAILTASLMTAGGAAYLLQDSYWNGPRTVTFAEPSVGTADRPCHGEHSCPASKSSSPSCSEPCELCELCCTAGVQAAVSAKGAVGEVCCLAGAACCNGAQVVAKPAARETCCEVCETPAELGAAAATAGVSLK